MAPRTRAGRRKAGRRKQKTFKKINLKPNEGERILIETFGDGDRCNSAEKDGLSLTRRDPGEDNQERLRDRKKDGPCLIETEVEREKRKEKELKEAEIDEGSQSKSTNKQIEEKSKCDLNEMEMEDRNRILEEYAECLDIAEIMSPGDWLQFDLQDEMRDAQDEDDEENNNDLILFDDLDETDQNFLISHLKTGKSVKLKGKKHVETNEIPETASRKELQVGKSYTVAKEIPEGVDKTLLIEIPSKCKIGIKDECMIKTKHTLEDKREVICDESCNKPPSINNIDNETSFGTLIENAAEKNEFDVSNSGKVLHELEHRKSMHNYEVFKSFNQTLHSEKNMVLSKSINVHNNIEQMDTESFDDLTEFHDFEEIVEMQQKQDSEIMEAQKDLKSLQQLNSEMVESKEIKDQTTSIQLKKPQEKSTMTKVAPESKESFDLSKFPCQCGSIFLTKKSALTCLNSHKAIIQKTIVEGERLYPCSKCSYNTSDLNKLENHKAIHTNAKAYKCEHCPYATQFVHVLEHHIKGHFANKTYACEQCSFSTDIMEGIIRHKTLHSLESPLVCNECSFQSVYKYVMKRHQLIHAKYRGYTCEECGFHCKNLAAFKRHTILHLPEPFVKAAIEFKYPKPFKCDECNSSFARFESLSSHKQTHTGINLFACDMCDYTSKNRYALNRHKFSHASEKPCKCNECDYSTSNPGDLRKHALKHANKRDFPCDQCFFRGRLQGELNRHKKTHGTERPYKCDHCAYSCARSDYLKVHKQMHTVPFACDECDYRTTQARHLKSHKLKHSGEKPFACTNCEFRTRTSKHLQRHIKSYCSVRKNKIALEEKGLNVTMYNEMVSGDIMKKLADDDKQDGKIISSQIVEQNAAPLADTVFSY